MEEGWDVPALEQIPSLLGGLKDRGLVAELDAWVSRYAEDNTEPAPGISALAVPTKDRPEMLDRALEAWVRNLHDRGEPDIVIADDSDLRAEESRAVVEKHASPYPGRVYVLDQAFRSKLGPGVVVCTEDRPQRILPAAGFSECRHLGRPSAHDGFDLHVASRTAMRWSGGILG